MGNLARRAVGGLARAPVVAGHTQRTLARRTPIMYAHYAGDWVPRYLSPHAGSTPDWLHTQLSRLRRWFRFASLADVLAFNRSGADPGQPLLAVTFDDGFDLMRDGVLNVLAEHGVSATTFVVTSTVDNANLMWRHKLRAIQSLRPRERCVKGYNALAQRIGQPAVSGPAGLLRASLEWPMDRKEELADELWAACDMPPLTEYLDEHRPYCTWEGILEWLDRGHAVGFHSDTHPVCARLADEALPDEIIEPARALKARLGLSSLAFSYPFGARLDEATERRVSEEGGLDCMLGSGGFSRRGTAPHRLERVSFEGDPGFRVLRGLLAHPSAHRGATV